MGKIAEALRANLQKVAQSDARSLRALQSNLEAVEESQTPVFTKESIAKIKSLLGTGTFEQLNVKVLKSLCKQYGVPKYSGLLKADLVAALKRKGVQPPPRPIGSLTKAEMKTILELIDVYKLLGCAN